MAGLPIRRLRPSSAVIGGLVAVLWAGSSGAIREFVWADLRDGVVRLGDLPRATRGLARVGFLLLLAMITLMLGGDVLRASSDLLATSSGPVARGAQVPVALLPLTLFVFSVAWAFLLSGAVRTHPAITVAVVGIYLATAISWLGGSNHLATRAESVAAWALVLAVPAVLMVRRRARERPVLEFLVLLVLVAGATGLGLLLALRTLRTTGIPIVVVTLDLLLSFLRGLVTPLLILIGLDIADFVLRVSHWTSQIAEERLHRWAVPALFAGLLGWQGFRVVEDVITEGVSLSALVGALLVPALAILAARLVGRGGGWRETRTNGHDYGESLTHDTAGHALSVTLGYLGWQVLLTVALLVSTAAVAVVDLSAEWTERVNSLLTTIGELTTRGEFWRFGFWIASVVVAVVLARRKRPRLALYFAVLGSVGLWTHVTAEGGPLDALAWTDAQAELCWLAVVIAVATHDLARRRWTGGRARTLLVVVVSLALLGASDFIEDPFSPVFAIAGIAFIAFGVLWDALTSGSWTNVSSPHLPRTSRLFLYLGYVLFSVTLIVWAVVSHDLDAVDHFTGGAAMDGFAVFGRPLVYAVATLLLFAPPIDPALPAVD